MGSYLNSLIMTFLVITPLIVLGAVWWLGGFTAIYAILFVWLVLYALRLVFRHQVIYNYRSSRMGDVVWFQVKPNGRKLSGTAVDRSKEQISVIHATLSRLTAPLSGGYSNRGAVYMVWAKRPPREPGGTVRLTGYIGVNRNTIDGSEGVLKGMAEKIGAEIKKLKGQPNFPVQDFVFAKEESYSTANVTDGGQTVLHPVAEKLVHDDNFTGHVVMAVECMKRSEKSRFTGHLNELGTRDAGDTKQHSGIAARSIDLMVNSCYRTSIAVCSAANGSRPEGVLSMVMSSLTENGVISKSSNPASENNRRSAAYSAIFTALCVGGMFVPFINVSTPLLAIFALFGGVLCVSTALNLGYFGQVQLRELLSRGVIAIPRYSWWSLRWRYKGLVNYYRLMAGGDELVRNRTANPSCSQVIHLHKIPLASFIAMPPVNSANDVEGEPIPEVGVSTDYVNKFSEGDLFMGIAGAKQPAYLPLDRIQFQFFAVGGASSGKSNFMQVLYTSAAHNAMCPKRVGMKRITPIWGESKGNGAYEAWDLVKDYGHALFIDCNSPKNRLRIALEGARLGEKVGGRVTTVDDVIRSTNHLTDMFKYMWRDDIKASSEQFLRFSLRIASLLSPPEIEMMGMDAVVNPNKPNLIELAYIVLGNDPRYRDISQSLDMLREELDRGEVKKGSREAYLIEAIITIGDTQSREVKQLVKAPSNKFSKMREVRWLWEPSESMTDVYVRDIIQHGSPVVINTGAYQYKDSSGSVKTMPGVGGELAEDTMKGLSYTIWTDVKRYGASWEAEGKRVLMFFDEVSHIAHEYGGRDVITEVVNEGRSFGCGMYAATQNIDRLEPGIAKQMFNMPGKAFFSQSSQENVEVVMSEIGGDSVYSRKNVHDLPRGTAISTVKTRDGSIGAFTLHAPYAPEWKNYLAEHSTIKDAAEAYISDHVKEDGDAW